jgi:hypothetical protein
MGSCEKDNKSKKKETDAMASTPAFLKTDPTGIDYYSFATRGKTTDVGG